MEHAKRIPRDITLYDSAFYERDIWQKIQNKTNKINQSIMQLCKQFKKLTLESLQKQIEKNLAPVFR